MTWENLPLPASRARLAAVLRATKEVVSIDAAAKALDLDRSATAKVLSRWRAQGWLRRIGRGLYVPVPLDLAGSEQVVEDPWVWFHPSSARAISAAGLPLITGTSPSSFSTRPSSLPRAASAPSACWRRASPSSSITQHRSATLASKPSGAARFALTFLTRPRTLIDMLAIPDIGGGIDHIADCLAEYRKSSTYEGALLVRYGEQFGNGAIFKRLGFLAETRLHDADLAAACHSRLTQGYAQLDPAMKASHLHTAWRLWVPERWKGGAA